MIVSRETGSLLPALFTRMPLSVTVLQSHWPRRFLFRARIHAFAVDVKGNHAGGTSSLQPTLHKRPEDKVSVGETGGGSFSWGKGGENKYVSVCKDVCLGVVFSAFCFVYSCLLVHSSGGSERGVPVLIGRYCFLLSDVS